MENHKCKKEEPEVKKDYFNKSLPETCPQYGGRVPPKCPRIVPERQQYIYKLVHCHTKPAPITGLKPVNIRQRIAEKLKEAEPEFQAMEEDAITKIKAIIGA